MHKIIYISQEKLSNKIIRDWFIQDFYKKHYEIEFWDITNLVEKNYQKNKYYKNIKLYEITDIKEFENKINQNKSLKPCYIIIVPYTYEALNIYKMITKHNLFTLFFYWGESPGIFQKRDIFTKIKNFFSLNLSAFKLLKRISQRQYIKLLRRINLINKYNICFVAGECCKKLAYSNNKVSINLCDYRQNLLTNKFDSNNKYAVFVDINLPYHEDNPYFNYKIDDKKYYHSLNNFFTKFEEKYKMSVIIAAHPKSQYNDDLFNGRKIYYLKTAELIKSCEHVLIHHSTAVSYAVLNYKSISFLITNGMFNTTDHYLAMGLSHYLGNNLINIDKLNDNALHINKINKKLYDAYKYNFIVSKETEGIDTFNIISETLEKSILTK